MRKLLVFATVLSFFSASASQEELVLRGTQADAKVLNSEVVRLKNFTNVPNYVQFRRGKEIPFANLESWLSKFYTTDATFGLKLIKAEDDKLGFTHFRYQQTINGIPVELTTYLAHVKDGKIVSVNGNIFGDVNPTANTALNETQALNKALGYINAAQYKWEIQSQEDHLKWEQEDPSATYYPKGELVFMNDKGNIKNTLKLAYKFNIYAQSPLSRREIFVDAITGEIVWEQNMLHDADVTGTASTLYSGTQTITCDNSSGPFRLRETGRGNGIRTYTNNNTTNYTNTDITNGSTTWTTPNAGVDAHWGAEKTYDYYFNVHGRNSIDGNGFALISYVNHDNNYQNAFWDGTRMTYGDGSGNNTPLTSIDIAGHEITHGLTSNTADLVYSYESGALNESFSDIFGNTIERVERPSQYNWKLGEDLNWIIRDMSNPNSKGDPDTYGGTNWYTGSNDNGGVHTNSGVQNFWYYLLTEGGSGTNDNNDVYTVSSIGITKSSEVAFRNLTVYLSQNSQYVDARFYAIQSAVDLFGGCSFEVEQVTNAWYAVGVGLPYSATVNSDFNAPALTSCTVPFTVNFNNTSFNASSYTWDFGDGNNSTQSNPSNTYLANGTYTVELIADGGLCGKDTTVKTAYIVVNTPTAPLTTGDMICPNSPANLSASGSGILNWFAGATGGPIINTGLTYTTPPLAATTTYYVSNSVAATPVNMAKPNNSGGGANYNYQQHLIFDVYQPMELISVEVYANNAGNRTIELRDNNGTPLQTATVNVAAGQQTVPLNFQIAPGTDYQLGLANSTANINMYRNNAGVTYPYTLSGIASITNSSASAPGYYYFFYNWLIKEADCESARTPVTANVQICTGIDDLNAQSTVTAYYNSNNIALSLNNIDKGNYTLTILNSLGQVVSNQQVNVTSDLQKEVINLNNKAKGIYYLNLYNTTNNYTVKVVK